MGFAENQAMGGAGVASSMGIYVNNTNPALLARNKYTIFSMGMLGQRKGLKTEEESKHSFAMNLNYINLAFPVKKHWSMGIGLQPYSYTDFKLKSLKTSVPGDTTNYITNFAAKGGVNKIAFNNAFEIGKELFFGLETSILFGQNTRESDAQLQNDGQFYKVNFTETQNLRGLYYRLGAAWRHKYKEDRFINLGLAWEANNKINNNRLRTTQTTAIDGTILNNPDTLANSIIDKKITLPSDLRFGFSLEHSLKSTIYADLSLHNGASFRNIMGENEGLRNSYTVSIGGEYFPSFTSTKFLKRTAYRVGLNYGSTPYSHIKTGKQLNNMSLSFGIGLPLRNSSLLNISYITGRKGTKADGGVLENYNRISLGFSLNDVWFIKQKID